jgi:hypothetical protein
VSDGNLKTIIVTLNFMFPEDVMWDLSVDFHVNFGSLWWTVISFLIRICDSKPSPPVWHPWKTSTLKWLRSIVFVLTGEKRGTHFIL